MIEVDVIRSTLYLHIDHVGLNVGILYIVALGTHGIEQLTLVYMGEVYNRYLGTCNIPETAILRNKLGPSNYCVLLV